MDSTHDAPYRSALDAYLAGVERTLPCEAVAGVYLTGSVALDALHQELEACTQPHTDAV